MNPNPCLKTVVCFKLFLYDWLVHHLTGHKCRIVTVYLKSVLCNNSKKEKLFCFRGIIIDKSNDKE